MRRSKFWAQYSASCIASSIRLRYFMTFTFGPLRTFAAATRSSFWADTQRAKTAAAIDAAGTPMSSAFLAVHLPVPFWPAVSRIESMSHLRLFAGSRCFSMSAVISMRKESRSPWFHSSKTSAISGGVIPRTFFIRK